MFNEMTTFGTASFTFIVFLNFIVIILGTYIASKFRSIGKELSPSLYGNTGWSIQISLSILSAFVPWLNLFNLVCVCVFAIVYKVLLAKMPEVADAIVSMKE